MRNHHVGQNFYLVHELTSNGKVFLEIVAADSGRDAIDEVLADRPDLERREVRSGRPHKHWPG